MPSSKVFKILIISGSPRTQSKSIRIAKYLYNRLLIEKSYDVELLDIRTFQLPQLDSVFDNLESTPELFKQLGRSFFEADAYILVTPEYNGTYTASLQNLFDHFPRQQKKVYGIVTATNGSMGGMRASQQLLLYVIALFGIVSPYMLITPFVDKKFDEDGNLMDDLFKSKIDYFLNEFGWLLKKVAL